MKKEKTIRTYQRRTKTGKVVTVKQHTAKYDAAEALKEAAKKKGAGDELESLKKKPQTKPVKEVAPKDDALGFTAEEFKAWYHWDQDADPKNKAALKVEKALKKQMGTKAYNKYFDELTDSYSSRGHNKAYKALGETLSTSASTKSVTSEKAAKSMQEGTFKKEISEAKKNIKMYEKSLKSVDTEHGKKVISKKITGEKAYIEALENGKSLEQARKAYDKASGGAVRAESLGALGTSQVKIGHKTYTTRVDKRTGQTLYSDGRHGWKSEDEVTPSKETKSKKSSEKVNYFGTKADLENAAKKLDGVLKSKGFYAKVAGSGIEVYKKGDRPSLKNLQVAIHGKDYVSWGPNEKNTGLRNNIEGALKEAFGKSTKAEKSSKESSFKKGDIIKKSGDDLRKEGFKPTGRYTMKHPDGREVVVDKSGTAKGQWKVTKEGKAKKSSKAAKGSSENLTFNKSALAKELKKFNGKIVGVQKKDGVVGVNVKFDHDLSATDFAKKNKNWRSTTNVGTNYEFVLMNKKGVEALRKKGFKL